MSEFPAGSLPDPAEEAAQRALRDMPMLAHSADEQPVLKALVLDVGSAAAREALKPLRELHRPDWDNCINACCSGPQCRNRTHICAHCETYWPCDTARLIYAEGEL